MEDLQRDMGRLITEHSKSPSKEDSPREKWSLLLVGSRGRIVRLHLGWGLAVGFAVCFLAVLLVIGFWRFPDFGWPVSEKQALHQSLQMEMDALRRENQRLMARLAALEVVMSDHAAGQYQPDERGRETEKPVEEVTDRMPVDVEIDKRGAAESLPGLPQVDIAFPKVALDSYQAGMQDGVYRVSFNIRNVRNDAGVSGHIISVLVPEDATAPYPASPAMQVYQGRPAEPQQGQFFSIRNFKDVRLRFGALDPGRYLANRIFVFNEAGDLLHVEEFQVVQSPL
ncbi:hypothetical protein OOT00_01995 [Desulfobotulus sp. H1]|uniref:Uncharacterized protein n=1 Tax=Desulfobotulus pelophilus TaxID=2823377 RepID=A0ABT3N5M0_9BACT|nr:hypothetical protein [Desulfobotulus pelophilus]MCW7752755.1 hypothetical protein [Desulfobotulus pelophilus]